MEEPPAPPTGYPSARPPPPGQGPPQAPAGYGPYPYGPPPPAKNGVPGWAIALIVVGLVAVLVLILGMMAAIAIPMFVNQSERARDSSVKEGIHSIQVGIRQWAVDHNDAYPPAEEVGRDGEVGRLVTTWPTNPFTDEPMKASPNEGDFTYRVTADGADCTLIGHLSGGEPFVIREAAGE